MDFKHHFSNQLKAHPSMQYQDAMKLCYQAAFGAEHLLFDEEASRVHLEEELASAEIMESPLVEYICNDVCRVNLGAWKHRRLPVDELFDVFKKSAVLRDNPNEMFLLCANEAEEVMSKEMTDFSQDEWRKLIAFYVENGLVPVRHSEKYRKEEKPSYRIVKSDYIKEEWL